MFKDQETENARSLGGGSNPLHFSWKTGLQDHQLTFSMHHPPSNIAVKHAQSAKEWKPHKSIQIPHNPIFQHQKCSKTKGPKM